MAGRPVQRPTIISVFQDAAHMQSPPPDFDRAITVIQVIPELDTGGAELSTLEVTQALVEAGHRAIVVSQGGRLSDAITAACGTIVTLPVKSKNPLTLRANARAIAALARRERADILHARSRAPAWSSLWAARRLGLAFVTTYHGAYGEKGPLKRLYNSVMARGDVVIANSNYTRELIRARYATPEERLIVIHRGVDLEAFDPACVAPDAVAALNAAWGIDPGTRVILQAARLTDWKGQHVVVEAAARLSNLLSGSSSPAANASPWVVVMAGDAQGREAYRESLLARAAALGVADRIKLVGHCADMPAAFARADVSVVASTEPEAFGRAAAEAQAMGCPVIATNIGAPPETVRGQPEVEDDVRTGWLVPPGDGDALAGSIAAALALSPGERTAWARRARQHVAARFSTTALQAATLGVYARLMAARKHPLPGK